MVEPLPYHPPADGSAKLLDDDDQLLRAGAVAAGLGATASYTWLKVPAGRAVQRMLSVTTLPALILGGAPGPDPEVTFASWQEAIALLANGDVDFVLGDWAQLSYLSRLPDFAGRIAVQSTTFRLEPYGWGISPRRPELRAAIDRELMARIRSTEWRFVVQQYMGSGGISPQ